MKKGIIFAALIVLILAVSGCGNVLHNAGGVQMAKLTAVNLPEDGTYAIRGQVMGFEDTLEEDADFIATYVVESSDGTAEWTFDPAVEFPLDQGNFKIYRIAAGEWWQNVPWNSDFADTGFGNEVNIFDAEGITVDGAAWNIEWDASKEWEEVLTATKP